VVFCLKLSVVIPVSLSNQRHDVNDRAIIGEVVCVDRLGNLFERQVANSSDDVADASGALIKSNGSVELFLKERPAADSSGLGSGSLLK
jgi:hypothetical protein